MKLTLATRLLLAFGIVLLMSLLSSGLAVLKLGEVQDRLEDVVGDNNVKIRLNTEMAEAVHVVSRVIRTVVLLDDEQKSAAERRKIDEARAAYDRARAALEKFAASTEGAARRAAIDAAAQKARPLNSAVLQLGIDHKDAEALALLLQQAAPATDAWEAALAENVRFQEGQNAKALEDARAAYGSARALLIGFALLNLAVAAVLATLITRRVVRQLGGEPDQVEQLAGRIADADLSTAIALRPGDSTSVMAAMARMQGRLAGVIATVRSNAEGVATASSQIAQGTQDLSGRTEQQASALQETAATMEELGGTVRNNAGNAHQADELARSAAAHASAGGEVVGQVVGTMREIQDSSRRIADIIGVIDGIAFQTNILALNAAVEAARAGEQGRGFAVVATEVRTLAQRSAEAAREIKSLITSSVERVEQGTALVDKAGATMTDIVTSVQRVAAIVSEISSATAEQSNGVSQVGTAVGQMDQATQQNAALVEESAAAAESLKQQAQKLAQAVAVFRLAEARAA